VVGFPGVDGRVRWLRISTRRLTDEGPPFTVVVSFVDITDQREADARLAEADRRFELAFELAPIGVALVSLNGRLLRVNRALCEMFGYSQEELLGTSLQEVDESEDLEGDLEQFGGMLRGELSSYEMEKSFAAKDGSRVWASVSTSLVRSDDDQPLYFIAQIVDVTQRRRLERELRHQAEHDSLTGLANRRVLAAELGRELARDGRYGGESSLLLMDLDGFKEVNDNFGHAVGDLVLQGVANVLRARIRDTDLAARLGGDEFAVLLPSTGRGGAEVLASDLVHAVRELEVAPGAAVTASVGVACSGELPGELDEERLLMAADDAMYEAKRTGRDRVS
jgi:diguanylate cyclase (GGDEF)-like protein/PAS domain S-box-containing protein